MAVNVTSAPKISGTARMCSALVTGHKKECLQPVLEGVEISLCPLHLLLASQEANRIGAAHLVELVKAGQ